MQNTKPLEPTISDVLEAIQTLSTHVDGKFEEVDVKFKQVDDRLDKIDDRLDSMDARFDRMDARFDRMDARFDQNETYMKTLVTKEYFEQTLEDKLSRLRGDLIWLARKSNSKLSELIEELVRQGSLERPVADRILALEPFPS